MQTKQKAYYDRRARSRKFDVGDEVLLLLPTDSNKLLLQWKGPYKVIEVVNRMDYKIDVNGVVSTYHANMLKQYVIIIFPRQTCVYMLLSEGLLILGICGQT